MGFQIFLVIFLIGIGAKANPMESCMEMLQVNEEVDSMIRLASEEELNDFCEKMSSFLGCINRSLKDQVGFDLNELADLLEGTDVGKALRIFVNMQELLVEMCTDGTELHDEYLANAQCFNDMPDSIAKDCEKQAQDAYSTFRELQEEVGGAQTQADEPCVSVAYQLGCLGADIRDHCGEQGLDTYKKFVRKIGLFKSGLCSSELMNTIKTDFLDHLEITEDQKSLYRVILDLKRRRR